MARKEEEPEGTIKGREALWEWMTYHLREFVHGLRDKPGGLPRKKGKVELDAGDLIALGVVAAAVLGAVWYTLNGT